MHISDCGIYFLGENLALYTIEEKGYNQLFHYHLPFFFFNFFFQENKISAVKMNFKAMIHGKKETKPNQGKQEWGQILASWKDFKGHSRHFMHLKPTLESKTNNPICVGSFIYSIYHF
ncbi:hypothetical protein I3843_05G123000 [Carya illinoinensis]|nr:hypothetical protein I3843_05G123000 [Carya illinoinensis]